jgi:hypothetical protein
MVHLLSSPLNSRDAPRAVRGDINDGSKNMSPGFSIPNGDIGRPTNLATLSENQSRFQAVVCTSDPNTAVAREDRVIPFGYGITVGAS